MLAAQLSITRGDAPRAKYPTPQQPPSNYQDPVILNHQDPKISLAGGAASSPWSEQISTKFGQAHTPLYSLIDPLSCSVHSLSPRPMLPAEKDYDAQPGRWRSLERKQKGGSWGFLLGQGRALSLPLPLCIFPGFFFHPLWAASDHSPFSGHKQTRQPF